jgi:FkbM family methyltransferase
MASVARRAAGKIKRLILGAKPQPAIVQPEPQSVETPPSPALTRDYYINLPSPIADDLRAMYPAAAPLTIFDIGCCEGEDSIKYARLFPNSTIYAFEPVPSNVAIIRRQLEKYSINNVQLFPIAFSDSVGTASFFVSSGAPEHLPNTEEWDYGNKSSSLLPPGPATISHYPWLKFDEKITVETDTLQRFCKANGIESIDLVHMDIQGAELKVLAGAGPLLSKINALWMEVERMALYEGQPLESEVESFMTANGFLKVKDTVGEVTGDHLYIRRDSGLL